MACHFKSVAKAITWRVLGAADTFVLSFFVTGKATAAVGIVGFELLTKSVLYYGHERAWEISWLANPSRGDALARSATRYLIPVFNRSPYSRFVASGHINNASAGKKEAARSGDLSLWLLKIIPSASRS